MPARALYRSLLEHCEGRVARSDIGWADDPAAIDDEQRAVEGKDLADLFPRNRWTEFKNAQRLAEQGAIDMVKEIYVDYELR